MAIVALKKSVPDFAFNATHNTVKKLSDFRGHNLVLYFYPKDNTPGCTTEGNDFNQHLAEFTRCNTIIFGVSRDSLETHEKFKAKKAFKFELISDRDAVLCQLFDVIKPKNKFGIKFDGIERSTFLIDQNGILQEEWRKVSVNGHVEKVLAAAQKLTANN